MTRLRRSIRRDRPQMFGATTLSQPVNRTAATGVCTENPIRLDGAPWLPPTTSKAERFACSRGRVRHGRSRKDRRPHRRAHGRGLARERRIAVEHAGQRGRNRAGVAREEPVGAAEHRIGIVYDTGRGGEPRRDQRRKGRIAAEPDDGHGLQPADQVERDCRAAEQRDAGAGERQRVAAAHGLARHHIDHVAGEQAAVAQRAGIGGKADAKAALDQLDAERFGGE